MGRSRPGEAGFDPNDREGDQKQAYLLPEFPLIANSLIFGELHTPSRQPFLAARRGDNLESGGYKLLIDTGC
jgi:hypothetical protein